MNKRLQKIKDLIKEMPKCDIKLCEEFLEKRKFEELRSLVVSDISKVSKESREHKPKENRHYDNINLDALIELENNIKMYLDMLEPYEPEDNYLDQETYNL
jgi:hypothetical protein